MVHEAIIEYLEDTLTVDTLLNESKNAGVSGVEQLGYLKGVNFVIGLLKGINMQQREGID